MIILSCETSTLLGSVAIHKNNQLLSEKSIFRQGSHSDTLNVMINECLAESEVHLTDVDVFATGLGPGSFTGIRISFNTIKTFAAVYSKPVTGIHSLYNLAYLNQNLGPDICCAINAFKNMVYIATYRIENGFMIETKPAQVVRVQALNDFLQQPYICVGDAFTTYANYLEQHCPNKIIRPDGIKDFPLASVTGHLVGLESKKFHWSELLPLYLRASEAEENLNGIKFQPL